MAGTSPTRARRMFNPGTSSPASRSGAQPGNDVVTSGPAVSFARPQPIRFVILAPKDWESSGAPRFSRHRQDSDDDLASLPALVRVAADWALAGLADTLGSQG